MSFDDTYASQLTIAAPLMQANGIKGTAYIVGNALDAQAYYLTTAQADTLYNTYSWDLGDHTLTHTDLTTLGLAQQEAELLGGKAALDGHGWTRASNHVAYPAGKWNADTLIAMANTGMITGRLATNAGINIASYNLYVLDCYTAGYGQTLAQIKAKITAWVGSGNIASLYFHDIGGANDPSVEDFTALCEWIKAQGYRTYTISEVRALLE